MMEGDDEREIAVKGTRSTEATRMREVLRWVWQTREKSALVTRRFRSAAEGNHSDPIGNGIRVKQVFRPECRR